MTRPASALAVYLIAAGFRPPLSPPDTFPRNANERLWVNIADPHAAAILPTLVQRLEDARGEGIDLILTRAAGALDGSHNDHVLPAPRAGTAPRERASEIRDFLAAEAPAVLLDIGPSFAPAMIYGAREAGLRVLGLACRRWPGGSGARRLLNRPALRLYDGLYASDTGVAQSLNAAGAAPGQVVTIGPLEDTVPPPPVDPQIYQRAAAALGVRPVWMAAPLAPEEAEAVLSAHRQASGLSHRLLLVIVPDSTEDGDAIEAMALSEGFTVTRRRAGLMPGDETQILISDAGDELGLWYRLAPITFVGRSLGPPGGDERPDAPAALGSAILYGPEVGARKDDFDRLASLGAARLVHSGKALGAAVSSLLAPDKTAAMAHAAWIEISRGAEGTDRMVDALMEALDQPGAF